MLKVSTKKIVSARKALITLAFLVFIAAISWVVIVVFLLFNGGHKLVRAPHATFHVSVAGSPEDREKGLSFTDKLQKNEGKLFVFDTSNRHGFWMKDMNYPIDIVWLDSEKKVVHVENSVEPNSYPNVFYTSEPDKYVLEIAAGSALSGGISKGVTLKW